MAFHAIYCVNKEEFRDYIFYGSALLGVVAKSIRVFDISMKFMTAKIIKASNSRNSCFSRNLLREQGGT